MSETRKLCLIINSYGRPAHFGPYVDEPGNTGEQMATRRIQQLHERKEIGGPFKLLRVTYRWPFPEPGATLPLGPPGPDQPPCASGSDQP